MSAPGLQKTHDIPSKSISLEYVVTVPRDEIREILTLCQVLLIVRRKTSESKERISIRSISKPNICSVGLGQIDRNSRLQHTYSDAGEKLGYKPVLPSSCEGLCEDTLKQYGSVSAEASLLHDKTGALTATKNTHKMYMATLRPNLSVANWRNYAHTHISYWP